MKATSHAGILSAILGITLMFGAVGSVCRGDNEMEAANRAFANGSFDTAADQFQKMVDQRGYSAALCFDLANAEARANRPGPALLNYERARYLAPANQDIDHNLQLERKKAGLEPNTYRWWQVMLRSIDWTIWMGIIVADLLLIALAIVMLSGAKSPGPASAKRGGVRLVYRGILFGGIPLAFFLAYVEVATIGFNQRVEGVIVASKAATLWLSPIDLSESVGTIPEGELVTVEGRHKDYLRIEARDHHFGWISQKDLAPVIAGSFDPKSSD